MSQNQNGSIFLILRQTNNCIVTMEQNTRKAWWNQVRFHLPDLASTLNIWKTHISNVALSNSTDTQFKIK